MSEFGIFSESKPFNFNIISYISLNNGNETNVMNMVMIDLNHFYKFCLAVYCIRSHLKIVNLSLNLTQVILNLV